MPAIQFNKNESITYGDLNHYVNQVANFLLDNKISHKSIVCINLEKSLTAYCILLASIKIGATYFALDFKSPSIRTKKIFEKCKPNIIFTSDKTKFNSYSKKILIVEDDGSQLTFCKNYQQEYCQLHFKGGTKDVAYVMFTSGSTGNPKGAKISHENLSNFILWSISTYKFKSGEKHSHLNPFYFDNSVFDIYSTFFSGGTLVVFTESDMESPQLIVDRIEETKCNILFSVPSLYMYLQSGKSIESLSFMSVKTIIFGGEGYPKNRLIEIFQLLSKRVNFYNVYGPTECTCICSSIKLEDCDFEDLQGFPKIGKLSKNFNHILTDELGNIVPRGEVGELLLCGPCIGLGYSNDELLTKNQFINNFKATTNHSRFYKTGDLFKLDDDNNLWFVGRRDFQIKHQGYRIELEEIEHGLMLSTKIAQASVIHLYENSVSMLMAFVEMKNDEIFIQKEIKSDLAFIVPKYMIPSKIFMIDKLPKNRNGKVDKNNLKLIVLDKLREKNIG